MAGSGPNFIWIRKQGKYEQQTEKLYSQATNVYLLPTFSILGK